MLSMTVAMHDACFTSFCEKQAVKADFKWWADVNGIWLKRHKAAFKGGSPTPLSLYKAHSIPVVIEDNAVNQSSLST